MGLIHQNGKTLKYLYIIFFSFSLTIACSDKTTPAKDAFSAPDQSLEKDEGGDLRTSDMSDDALDSGEDLVEKEPLKFALNWPIQSAPLDPLAGSDVESCAVYQTESCKDGFERVCEIYDVETSTFDESPTPLLERAFLFDRWYDLYQTPEGQTAERNFTEAIAPGTDESIWSSPEKFAGWSGTEDSTLWTGTALNAYILRYLHTGTEADYLRMEEKARTMIEFFEVTRIPGYVARYRYLEVPEGTPPDLEIIHRSGDATEDDRDIEMPESLGFLPDAYTSGLGTPRWRGDPSIDQMNGPMMTFPMVFGLLRDEDLKSKIAFQMKCYFNNLQRIEIINLSKNQEAKDTLQRFFAGEINTDAYDYDFNKIDTIVMYVHRQINSKNEGSYDRQCSDFISTTPWKVLDAESPRFVVDMLSLSNDFVRKNNRKDQINHFYIPNLRGADAVHMMHLAAMVWGFTGDDRYREFLEKELLGNLQTAEVAGTMSILIPNKYCRKFFGTNIIAGPLWAFNNLISGSELGTYLQGKMRTEMWAKEAFDLENVNFNLMFAGAVSPEIGGADREKALSEGLRVLAEFGGNGGILNDPRRTYQRSFDSIVASFPNDTQVQCATEVERTVCEQDTDVFGIKIPGRVISFECTGASSECMMEDGKCTTALASKALSPQLRQYVDYVWQGSPFKVGDPRSDGRQSAGVDYIEQYWMARYYDFIQGNKEVLAWKVSTQACNL